MKINDELDEALQQAARELKEEEARERERLDLMDESCRDDSHLEDEKLSPLHKRIERRYQSQKDTQQRLKMRGRTR